MSLFRRDSWAFLGDHGRTICQNLLEPLVTGAQAELERQGWRAGAIVSEPGIHNPSGAILCRVRQAYGDADNNVQFQLEVGCWFFNNQVVILPRILPPESQPRAAEKPLLRIAFISGSFQWSPMFGKTLDYFYDWLTSKKFEAPLAHAKVHELCNQFEAFSSP